MDSGVRPLSPVEVEAEIKSDRHEGYFHRVAEEADVLLNVIIDGKQDETVSSREARAAQNGELVGELVTHALDCIQDNHGAKAELADEVRGHDVAKLEEGAGAPKVSQ